MKRLVIVGIVVSLIGIGSYALFAQQAQPQPGRPGMMQGGMMQGGMMQGGMQGDMPMCPMCSMAAGGMMQKSMVAVDGGIIMAVGNKLIKYDDQLNKVEEVELEMDMAQMHQKMQQMMQSCPMMQKMQGGQTGQSGAQTDHQQHHPGQP